VSGAWAEEVPFLKHTVSLPSEALPRLLLHPEVLFPQLDIQNLFTSLLHLPPPLLSIHINPYPPQHAAYSLGEPSIRAPTLSGIAVQAPVASAHCTANSLKLTLLIYLSLSSESEMNESFPRSNVLH
jgi:hypothetical protein